MSSQSTKLKISYKPLWKTLIDKGMRKQDLREKAKISASTIAKLGRDENVTTAVLVRICEALECGLGDVAVIERRPSQENISQ
ncbi:helix-turn-helix domain-containing protein [Corynebacterium sp. 153RC1]|uniref:helix-turn-helix domain-containing protein n=1 Tax=unclassified Corynebacterium TaxID=2624378 RepID=UPI00211CDFB7|nr:MULTISPECIES: helix-turn-helix domain-containing protein [unclassified Corynebacterium]MCQ9352983.1 helix-turn-helix domain-containing protein [Corynebacterium sp. 209RC1]MCQ9355179.1 helix-turn-helix domain-containing protein [Corynebacterium sp. 1222RC1]MCQ9357304.1 helix-turn-helix domain-containing protein [Corynebacterium sp. 122RC1]MCQ9359480.1 helix-turn-helix domain-containing protein [Corynebacterium sp. 142RC1]MCQ9361720.1 helix-turn-helix domain-containing protein [Corynebacteriu